MADIFLTLNIVADVLALLVISYIISKFAFTRKEIVKSRIAIHYAAMKRDRIFRNSLVLLAISLFFSLLSFVFAIIYFNRAAANIMQFLSSIFRIVFFLYLFNRTRKTFI